MRPVRLNPEKGDWRSWRTFVNVMEEFQRPEVRGGQWAGRRNKLIALRETLREGPDAVRYFLNLHEPLSLPSIPGRLDMSMRGWHGGECGYFDVIEALDFFVSLEGGSAI